MFVFTGPSGIYGKFFAIGAAATTPPVIITFIVVLITVYVLW
jgi:hypothetical protein